METLATILTSKDFLSSIPYNASTDANTGNLRLQFLNLRSDIQECIQCRVWFSLIGKAKDLPE